MPLTDDQQCTALTLCAAYTRLQELQVDLDRSDPEEAEYTALIGWWTTLDLNKKSKICKLLNVMANEEVEGISHTIGKRKPDRKIIMTCVCAYGKMLELRVKMVVNHIVLYEDQEQSKRLEYWWSDMDNYRHGVILSWVKFWQNGYEVMGELI